MIFLPHLNAAWLAGRPGVDIDLSSPEGALKVLNIIPEDLTGLSSVDYLKSVLERISK